MQFATIDPSTNKLIKQFHALSDHHWPVKVNESQRAFADWQKVTLPERAFLLHRVAEILRDDGERFAALMSEEMGKPITESRGEVKKCAWVCDYFAEHGEQFLAAEPIVTEASKSYVCYQPLGLVLAIMPWNFPFWQFFRFAAPALMAGNGILLKHAPNVPGCAEAIEKIFQRARFPLGLVQNLFITHEQTAALIEHPAVQAVTFTGSTAAGREVAALAGRALKKTVLELGGSDPYLILDDADLDLAVTACAASRLLNGGQSCIAAKRFIVTPAVLEQFTFKLLEKLSAVRMGDPLDEGTMLGPLARLDLRDNLHRQVVESVAAGATLLLGGEMPDGAGAYYPATLLSGVKLGMPAYTEELFGPVAVIIAAADEADAIRIANDTIYGLGAAVFTQDLARGERIAAEQLQAGATAVNDFVRSDPRVPFGGIKASGYGRELASFGLMEFVNVKAVVIK